MKVFVYNFRRFDEEEFFVKYTEEMGMELAWTEEAPTLENCDLAAGCDFVSVQASSMPISSVYLTKNSSSSNRRKL